MNNLHIEQKCSFCHETVSTIERNINGKLNEIIYWNYKICDKKQMSYDIKIICEKCIYIVNSIKISTNNNTALLFNYKNKQYIRINKKEFDYLKNYSNLLFYKYINKKFLKIEEIKHMFPYDRDISLYIDKKDYDKIYNY